MIAAAKVRKSNIAIEDTYDDVRKLIYDIAHAFVRRYGGDFNEYVSEGNFVYMKAYESWRPDGGANFTTYLWGCVWHALLDLQKRRIRRERFCPWSLDQTGEDETRVNAATVPARQERVFSTEGFTTDAKIVIDLVLEAPAELLTMVTEKGGEIRNWRSSLREYLREMGWTANRIAESFKEIGDLI